MADLLDLRGDVLEFLQLEVVLLDFFLPVAAWMARFLLDHRRRFGVFVQHLEHCFSLLLGLFGLLRVCVAYHVLDWSGWTVWNAEYEVLRWQLDVEVLLTFLDLHTDV